MKNEVIKFRVWDGRKFHTENICILDGKPYVNFCSGEQSFHLIEIYGGIIQQFTKLLDKNKKEIFEGDIVFCSKEQMERNNTPMIYDQGYYAEVKYCAPIFTLKSSIPVFWSGIEIVGNIFENPDLLK